LKKALVLCISRTRITEIAETLGISEVNARVKMNRIKGKQKNIKSLRSMKELDLLKDWQKNKDSFEQVSEIEITG
jgi:hypothetical protein